MKKQNFRIFVAMLIFLSLVSVNFVALAQQGAPDQPISPNAEIPSFASPDVSYGQPGFSLRYVHTYGVNEEPYPSDGQHLNGPKGLAIDATDHIFTVEGAGLRLLKFNSSGTNQLIIGKAGQPWHHADFLAYPKDVALDNAGNIWVTILSGVKKFDAAGAPLMIFPSTDPWNVGDDNDHFDTPRGIAFNSAGQLFVADTNNHRIQVFDVSGNTITYSETIGVSGSPMSDNTGFNTPAQLAFDSSGQLYVMDTGNYRVQRCTKSGAWSCSTYFGETGVPGNDLTHLKQALGIYITSDDTVFIADNYNYRVLKCNLAGVCTHFAGTTGTQGWANNQFWWPEDVVVDSSGNVYVSDYDNHRIQKFNSAGVYQSTIGVTRVPYVPDTTRLNGPGGVAIAPDGSMYINEHAGFRLLKFNKDGEQQWAVGQAGVYGKDNAHLGGTVIGAMGNPALDSIGNVYLADSPNFRIQIFNANGEYQTSFGGFGTGEYGFDYPAGVAFSPVNGDMYIVDMYNFRIQIYNKDREYKATLGEVDIRGADNAHFDLPRGVTVDKNGTIYVADTNNHRVQIFDSNLVYQRTVGVSAECGSDFAHLCYPTSVNVDDSGRLYVNDASNNRVQVFDSAGAYLTTIGGRWGNNTGEMRYPWGQGLDAEGNLYVVEPSNHRVQKYTPGTPMWVQSNLNGFGERANAIVATLQAFNDQLYAGTYNGSGTGAQLWRYNGSAWSSVMTDGFGDSKNVAIDHLYEFDGKLYAGTWNRDTSGGVGTAGAQIWRSNNGSTWNRVTLAGFDAANGEIVRFIEFNGQIYASAWSNTIDHGGEIWRSDNGDSDTWSQVVANGFNGDVNNPGIPSLAMYNSQLYAGTYNVATGGEVWRSPSGGAGSWTQVNLDGFGSADNVGVDALVPFKGYLYAGVSSNPGTGAQIWRCQVCDGSDWTNVMTGGFGDANTAVEHSLIFYKDGLVSIAGNPETGMVVYRSEDGTAWEQIGFAGFGDSNNRGGFWGNSAVVFNDKLYTGTDNDANGGEVWLYSENLILLHLPLVMR